MIPKITFLYMECHISSMFSELSLLQMTKEENKAPSMQRSQHTRYPSRWMVDFDMEQSEEVTFDIRGVWG